MKQLSADIWRDLDPGVSPFLRYEFHAALEASQSVGESAGWIPHHQGGGDHNCMLLNYLKAHSYGEYIFDWSWADAYERTGLAYYPKLTSMIPFTPAATPHFLMKNFNEGLADSVLKEQEEVFLRHELSSTHFLFLVEQEREFFHRRDYLIRESMQYHFHNEGWRDFEDYLSALKPRKARNIQKERKIPAVTISQITGEALNESHAREMYRYYLSTINEKSSYAYLHEDFFLRVFRDMKDSILFVRACKDERPVAGALFFYGPSKLYGRYWGASEFIENLHFELCYYQGIDFCLAKKLSVFEAGAQGEHKIQRGFRPIRTYSAHKIKHPAFSRAISQFIAEEKAHLARTISVLEERLPFRPA